MYLIVCISSKERKLLASNIDKQKVKSIFIIIIIAYNLLLFFRVNSLKIISFLSNIVSLVLGFKSNSSFLIVIVGYIIIAGMVCVHACLLIVYRGTRVKAVVNKIKDYIISSIKWINSKLSVRRRTLYYILLMLFVYKTTTIEIYCSCTTDMEYIYTFHHINFNHFNYCSYLPYIIKCLLYKESIIDP